MTASKDTMTPTTGRNSPPLPFAQVIYNSLSCPTSPVRGADCRAEDTALVVVGTFFTATYSGSSSGEIDTAGAGAVSRRRVRFEEPWAGGGGGGGGGEETAMKSSEVKTLLEERESGVSYMIGHTSVLAHESSPAVKKFAVNVVYGFLRRNSRRPAVELGIPNTSLIEVGMTYRV